MLSHNAKLVLSFTTQKKCWDPRDPLRSLITSHAPKLTLIKKSYTSVKQEDNQVTNFKNTFAMQKEMTRTHPVIRHLNLPNHSKQHMAVCCLSLHLGSSEGSKTLEKKFIFQIGTLNHHSINKPFSFNQFILVLSLLYSHSYHSSIFCI